MFDTRNACRQSHADGVESLRSPGADGCEMLRLGVACYRLTGLSQTLVSGTGGHCDSTYPALCTPALLVQIALTSRRQLHSYSSRGSSSCRCRQGKLAISCVAGGIARFNDSILLHLDGRFPLPVLEPSTDKRVRICSPEGRENRAEPFTLASYLATALAWVNGMFLKGRRYALSLHRLLDNNNIEQYGVHLSRACSWQLSWPSPPAAADDWDLLRPVQIRLSSSAPPGLMLLLLPITISLKLTVRLKPAHVVGSLGYRGDEIKPFRLHHDQLSRGIGQRPENCTVNTGK